MVQPGAERGAGRDRRGGGKEVHADDVARAVDILLTADGIAGEVYNCCDRYVSQYEVATIAKTLSGSPSDIRVAILRRSIKSSPQNSSNWAWCLADCHARTYGPADAGCDLAA